MLMIDLSQLFIEWTSGVAYASVGVTSDRNMEDFLW